MVLETGFLPYQEETLYRRPGSLTPSEIDGLRPLAAMDTYFVFRLYNHCTPEAVRRLEAATFAEWQAAQDRRWLKHGVQMVIEREGGVAGLVNAAPHASGISIDLIVDGARRRRGRAAARRRGLLRPRCALRGRRGARAVDSEGLAGRLEDAGFQPQREFVSLMRRTTRPLAMPRLRPAIAKNAVGV